MAYSPSENTRKSFDETSSHLESHKPADNDERNKNKHCDSQCTCYCGKDRNLNIVELLCASCNRWFHESCIGYQLGKLVPFMTNYLFICKNCSPTGLETFKKNQAPFPQMCLTAIANLRQESIKDCNNKLLFSKDREIIPYIDQYWEAMTTMPRRVTQSWYATVQRALIKDIQVLFIYEEDAVQGPMFGLYNIELTNIKPNYEAMIKQGQLKVTDMGIATRILWAISDVRNISTIFHAVKHLTYSNFISSYLLQKRNLLKVIVEMSKIMAESL